MTPDRMKLSHRATSRSALALFLTSVAFTAPATMAQAAFYYEGLAAFTCQNDGRPCPSPRLTEAPQAHPGVTPAPRSGDQERRNHPPARTETRGNTPQK